jgi:hypothetical protein
MKKKIFLLALTLSICPNLLHLSRADSNLDPVELIHIVPDQVKLVVSPSGKAGHIQIVTSGQFTNTCYSQATMTAEVDRSSKRIFVNNQAYLQTRRQCLQALVSYSYILDLGALAAGQYEIIILNNYGIEIPTDIPLAELDFPTETNDTTLNFCKT